LSRTFFWLVFGFGRNETRTCKTCVWHSQQTMSRSWKEKSNNLILVFPMRSAWTEFLCCSCWWCFRQSIDLYSSVPSPNIGFLGTSSLSRLSSSFLSTSLTRRHTPEALPSVTKPLLQEPEDEQQQHQRRSSHTLLPPLSSRRSSLIKKESKVSHEVPSSNCSFGQAVLNGKFLNLGLLCSWLDLCPEFYCYKKINCSTLEINIKDKRMGAKYQIIVKVNWIHNRNEWYRLIGVLYMSFCYTMFPHLYQKIWTSLYNWRNFLHANKIWWERGL